MFEQEKYNELCTLNDEEEEAQYISLGGFEDDIPHLLIK